MKYITNNFKTHIAKQFVESLDEPQNTIYYIGAHRSTPFASDSKPPEPTTGLDGTHYSLYSEMLFGKHVTPQDVVHMIRNIQWESGTVYDMYDTRLTNPETKDFYVVSQESNSYHIFKCLNNNGGVPSSIQPKRSEINPSDDFYRTSDGYEWKYMYSITPSQYLKFATNSYIPVFENAAVKNNAVSGSIDTLVIEDPGFSYYSYASGNIKEARVAGNNLIYSLSSSEMTLSSNDSFYDNCSIYISSGQGSGQMRTITDYFISGNDHRILIDSPFDITPNRTSAFTISPRVIISGDGFGAKARCDVNTDNGSIDSVTVINRGKEYTYASVEVVGNTGTTSVATTSSATVRAIISPPNGHGSDVINELYANKVGIAVEFVGSEANTIPATNDYRKISLIKDPLFSDANIILTEAAASSGLQIGETISQASTGAMAKITGLSGNTVSITNIRGFFETSQPNLANTSILDSNTSIVGSSSNIQKYVYSIDRDFETFDQRNLYTVEVLDAGINSNGFQTDELVVQAGLNQMSTSDLIKLTLSGSEDAYLFKDGEIVTQTNAGGILATGIVTSRMMNMLTIASASSYFSVNNSIVGTTSGATSTVTDYDNTFSATASAYVHELQFEGAQATGTIAVTNIAGSFLLTDDTTNTINSFKGQSSQAVASLIGLDTSRNKLVNGSGEVMYVENFIPITRDSDQTERIKLVIEF